MTDATPLVSASQISAFGECQRKWAWRYIARLETPVHPAAALGIDVDDNQLQPYLRDGRAFDFTRESGHIAAAGLAYLPSPRAPGLEVQKHFTFPAAKARRPDGSALFGYQGYKDLWLPDGQHMPEVGRPGVPVVGDFKTTSDLKWAKTPRTLATDPQATLYAVNAMFATGSRELDLVWIYFQTRGAKKVKRVHLRVVQDISAPVDDDITRVSAGTVIESFSKIDETATRMFDVRQAAQDVDPEAYVLSLPPTPSACEAYGGCHFRHRCNLSPAQIVSSLAKEQEVDMSTTASLLANLKARKVGTAAPEAAPAPTPPAPVVVAEPAPAELPAWATAPVDPLTKRGTPAPLGINPPESQLPPPVVAEAAPAPAAEEPKKRGRKQKAKTPAEPLNQPLSEDETGGVVIVTWAEETFTPVPYNTIKVGPFEARATARPGESNTDARARIYAELAKFAEGVRAEKLASFAVALKKVAGQ